jgi:heptosyltransferase-2
MPHSGRRGILVWLPNWIGDAVMATPALSAIRRRFADAAITFVGRPGPLAVLEGGGWADATIEDATRRRPRLRHALRLVRDLRRGAYARGLLLPNSFRTALLARLGGVGELTGYVRDARGWLLSGRLHPPRDGRRRRPVPTIDAYRALAEAVGAPCPSRRMTLAVSDADDRAAAALLAEANVAAGDLLVMVNPAGGFGPAKRWPAERFAAVADALADRRAARVIVHAAPGERAAAAKVAQAMRRPPAVSFARRQGTLGLLKALLRRCRLLVTNDTGARHVAAALGADVVTVFGSTDPTWARIDYPRERIVRVDVPCGPCQRRKCPRPPGPTYHQCMTAITPEMVLAAAEELLDAPRAEGPAA